MADPTTTHDRFCIEHHITSDIVDKQLIPMFTKLYPNIAMESLEKLTPDTQYAVIISKIINSNIQKSVIYGNNFEELTKKCCNINTKFDSKFGLHIIQIESDISLPVAKLVLLLDRNIPVQFWNPYERKAVIDLSTKWGVLKTIYKELILTRPIHNVKTFKK